MNVCSYAECVVCCLDFMISDGGRDVYYKTVGTQNHIDNVQGHKQNKVKFNIGNGSKNHYKGMPLFVSFY